MLSLFLETSFFAEVPSWIEQLVRLVHVDHVDNGVAVVSKFSRRGKRVDWIAAQGRKKDRAKKQILSVDTVAKRGHLVQSWELRADAGNSKHRSKKLECTHP